MGVLVLGTSAALASNTLSLTAGVCATKTGSAVPDGTLWVLMVDSGGTANALPQLNLDSSITSSGAAFNQSPFWYASLSVGSVIQGDTVFAMGKVDSTASGISGVLLASVVAQYGLNGISSGKNYGLYWFPGVTYTAPGTYQVGWGSGEVGGIQTTTGDTGVGFTGMVFPADTGADLSPGALTTDQGGSFAPSSFQAVNLIPEPSSMLLGALGALGLLRRRR